MTTLELFFDLVFAFTLTQLAAVLAAGPLARAVPQVLLIFGLLWWLYGGYAWLTNNRPPVRTPERIGLLLGMAGFLMIGLAIPRSFGGTGLALGLGYLAVVLVHSWMYFRVNRNIIRVAPFNVASALLVIAAGSLRGPDGPDGPACYALWAAALVVQLGSPLIVHPAGLFELRPSHFVERHYALVIVAIGESVAAIGIGGSRLAGLSSNGVRLLVSAILGLALVAALWWIVFAVGDEERVERILAEADGQRRTAMALSAFFYGFIPLLLGLIALAAGMGQAIAGSAAGVAPSTSRLAGTAAVLATGAALFLAGGVLTRRQLRLGPVRLRAAAAVATLATIPAGALVGLDAQLALLTALLVVLLVVETRVDERAVKPDEPSQEASRARAMPGAEQE